MIIEWLAPVSVFVFSARLLWEQVRVGWKGWEDVLKIVGLSVMSYFMLDVGIRVTQSLGQSIVFSTMVLTLAFIPSRYVMRLIRAKRPNEIQDPELFENGELTLETERTPLGQPKPD